jgi:hypothetical protein
MVGRSGAFGEGGMDHRILDSWFDTIEDEDMHLVVSRTVVSNEWYLC